MNEKSGNNMDELKPDNTIKEILAEDRNGFRKKPIVTNVFVRLLLIAILLFIGFYGFILFRQWRLNLEAEAIVIARQTATAFSSDGGLTSEDVKDSVDEKALEATPKPENTQQPDYYRTGTVSAEMTQVVEFQQTLAAE